MLEVVNAVIVNTCLTAQGFFFLFFFLSTHGDYFYLNDILPQILHV